MSVLLKPVCLVLLCWAFPALVIADPFYPAPDGIGSFSCARPDELQFSDFRMRSDVADDAAKVLGRGSPSERLAAARLLWRGHSREHAAAVLNYLAREKDDGLNTFRQQVEKELRPDAILGELDQGDYVWGAWLAFLRPHEKLVESLLAALATKPKFAPETMLALGSSRDPRALTPLLEAVNGMDYVTAGFAAHALGYFGGEQAEAALIKSLAADSNWQRWKACDALAKVGTAKSVSVLEKVATEDYPRMIDVPGAAKRALEQIAKRRKQAGKTATLP